MRRNGSDREIVGSSMQGGGETGRGRPRDGDGSVPSAAPRRRVAAPRAPRRAALWRSLAQDRGGATAVEFALLAIPFFALLCVIFEAAFLLLSQQTLDGAVDRAARVLRTGEFQDTADGTDPAERMRRLMCRSGVVFFRCEDLRLDVQRSGGFAAAQPTEAYDGTKKDWVVSFGTHFDCPVGGDIIALRAAVPVMRPFSALNFSGQTMTGGRQLLITTMIFRTEPYAARSCT